MAAARVGEVVSVTPTPDLTALRARIQERLARRDTRRWLPAPTHDGPWWVIAVGETDPRIVDVSDVHEDDGKICFSAGYFRTPEQSYESHFRDARWRECVPPVDDDPSRASYPPPPAPTPTPWAAIDVFRAIIASPHVAHDAALCAALRSIEDGADPLRVLCDLVLSQAECAARVRSPSSPLDLDAIEARARKRVLPCEWAPTRNAPASEFCGAPCVCRCNHGGDCGISRCADHAESFSGACDHDWHPIDDGAADTLALVKRVRELEAQVSAPPPAPSIDHTRAQVAALGAHGERVFRTG